MTRNLYLVSICLCGPLKQVANYCCLREEAAWAEAAAAEAAEEEADCFFALPKSLSRPARGLANSINRDSPLCSRS